MPIQINRDPFARRTLVRDIVLRAGYKGCQWCGRERSRFLYCWVPDGVITRPVAWQGPFCSVGCYRIYTEQ